MNLSIKQKAMLTTFNVVLVSVVCGLAVAASFMFVPVELLLGFSFVMMAAWAIKMLYNLNLSSLESAEKIKEMQERTKF